MSMSTEELRYRIGKRVVCRDTSCTPPARRWPVVLGYLDRTLRVATYCSTRKGDGDVIVLSAPDESRKGAEPRLLPRRAIVRCWNCAQLLDLSELERRDFA